MKIETTKRDQQGKQSQALMEDFHQETTCQHSKPKENILKKKKSEHFALKRMKVGESLQKQEKTEETDEHSEGLDINR